MNNIILNDMEDMYSSEPQLWDRFAEKTVLITGAYGMLASYLMWMFIYLNEFKKKNINILAFVRKEYKFAEKFGTYSEKSYIRVYQNDLLNEVEINEEVNFIFHAASLASPQFYEIMPVDVLLPNCIGTYNMLELARKHKELESFVFFSSGNIYGKIEKEIFKEDDMGELDPLDTRSCYGESKRMGETLCKSYYIQHKVPCKIVRISHTFGPTMDIKNDKRVFSEFVNNAVNGEDIIIKSDGKARRPFCYITDCIQGVMYTLLLGEDGEAYNVNRMDTYYSILEIALMIIEIKKGKIQYKLMDRGKNGNYIESINNLAIPSNEKIKTLGWQPMVNISEGFERTINYFESIK